MPVVDAVPVGVFEATGVNGGVFERELAFEQRLLGFHGGQAEIVFDPLPEATDVEVIGLPTNDGGDVDAIVIVDSDRDAIAHHRLLGELRQLERRRREGRGGRGEGDSKDDGGE